MLYYKRFNHITSKEWIVLIHGAGGSSAVWYKQIKAFKQSHNLLLIDLRGHGKSNALPKQLLKDKYSFKLITEDIIAVLDEVGIEKADFMGVSLGTILVRLLAELQPKRVKSLVMAGAVTRLNSKSMLLVFLGNTFKKIIPYMWLYKLFALVIMPKKQHSEARNLFINEAKKLCQKEFIRWFKLTKEINPLLRYFKESDLGIPTLYLMGDEDSMFLKPVRELVAMHSNSHLEILSPCGHVVNVQQADAFNVSALDFIALK